MEEKKVYSVAELAEKVGVPRTTIADWLNRFSQYMESEMRGKRKVFTDAALAVLTEIAALRDRGHSTYDIGRELAKRHPVQAELHQEPPPPVSAPPPEPEAEANALVAPNARLQAEELANILNGELNRMAQSFEQNQVDAKNLARKALFWQFGVVALLLAMGVAAVFAALYLTDHISRQKQETSNLVGELKQRENQLNTQEKKLDGMVVVLDKSREDYRRNVEKLRQDLKEQQASFEAELKKQSESSEKHQAELTRMREEFAKQQLDFLRNQEKIAQMREDAAKAEVKLKSTAEQLEQRERELRERERKLEELEKAFELNKPENKEPPADADAKPQ